MNSGMLDFSLCSRDNCNARSPKLAPDNLRGPTVAVSVSTGGSVSDGATDQTPRPPSPARHAGNTREGPLSRIRCSTNVPDGPNPPATCHRPIRAPTPCIAGFHVTLEAPSATSVGLCLTHVAMDKSGNCRKLADVSAIGVFSGLLHD